MNDRDVTQQYRIQQWAAAIKDQKASGLTIDQWCKQHEVSRYQFFYRQKAVRKALVAELEKDMQTSGCLPAQPDCTPTSSPVTRQQQVSFVALPTAAMPKPAGIAMKIQFGKTTVEVSNDASDRVLSLLREVLLHAE